MATQGWREVVARMLELAELNVRIAQREHDGSEGARERYLDARRRLADAEALAMQLAEANGFTGHFGQADAAVAEARAEMDKLGTSTAGRRYAVALFRRECLRAQFPVLSALQAG